MITVVIPALNEAEYLPQLLASLTRQQGIDLEMIVADAGSTDDTAAIALRAGARVVSGGLPGCGRNRGALMARGELLFFLDADVILSDEFFLRDCIQEFTMRGLDIATCDIEPISSERMDRFMHWVYNRYVRSTTRLFPHAPGFCILVKRSVHDAIRGFDEEVQYAEDQDYARRAARVGRFGVLDARRIPVSVRRFDRDGRFTIAAKNVIAEMHLLTVGPIKSDFLKYRFGYGSKHQR